MTIPGTEEKSGLTVLVVTCDRPEALHRCLLSLGAQQPPPLEVRVLDNGARKPLDVTELSKLIPGVPVRIDRSGTRLGVAAARQTLLDATSTGFALVLDDDAYLCGSDTVTRILRHFEQQPASAVLALPLLDHRRQPPRWLTPFGAVASLEETPPRRAGYFYGGAHALRTSALRAVGGHDVSFMYGEEELDLSYRLVGAGYEIWFDASIRAVHAPVDRPSEEIQNGRLTGRTRNRLVLARRYLPLPQALVFGFVWLGFFARHAWKAGALGSWAGGTLAGLRGLRSEKRVRLNSKAVRYLRAHRGRLWW